MVLPACFHLADDVFPRVRAEAARRLVEDGWSQTKAAGVLQVSQAMVSKYVSRTEKEEDALVLRLTDELIESLEAPDAASGQSQWCQMLMPSDGRAGAQEALDDLLAAERALMKRPPLELVPQIGLNIARAVPDAQKFSDILAFPGRIITAGDRLIAPVPPAWGASNHLATCLLALRKNDPQWTAIGNIRGDPHIIKAAEQAHIKATAVDRSATSEDGPILTRFSEGHAVIHDPGAVGIEPCLYIAGRTAQDVAATIHSIHSRIDPWQTPAP